MCGIIFAYDRELEREELLNRADKSINLLSHRGPDDTNIECFSNGFLCAITIFDKIIRS